jgi:hypothetical protein
MIIIVFGLPGSGKSFFASRLADKLSADYINTDKVRKEMFSTPGYSDEEKIIVYKRVLDEVYHYAHAKKDLVVDGTFYNQDIRSDFVKIGNDLNMDLRWIEVVADKDIVKNRLAEKRPYSDADYSIYKLIKKQYEPFENGRYLRIQSENNNISDMLKRAEEYLKH